MHMYWNVFRTRWPMRPTHGHTVYDADATRARVCAVASRATQHAGVKRSGETRETEPELPGSCRPVTARPSLQLPLPGLLLGLEGRELPLLRGELRLLDERHQHLQGMVGRG